VQVLVWKEMQYGSLSAKEKALLVTEVNVLRSLSSPFIVRYYDRIVDKASTTVYVVMEYCSGGDLARVIKRCKRDGTSLDEDFIWRCLAQMVCALKQCHQHADEAGVVRPILHRDLKPGNIFLDASRNIKVGDFGLAKELETASKYAQTSVGTPFYMSPEQINQVPHGIKSDIWALGCLAYEMAALHPPFDASNQLALAMKINAGKFDRVPDKYSDDLQRLVRSCLQLEQDKRPSVAELETVARMRPFAREASAIQREYSLNQSYHTKLRDLRKREEDVARREAELTRREADLARREARLSLLPAAAAGISSAAPQRPASAMLKRCDSAPVPTIAAGIEGGGL
jgi:NIMA (never in mitosis gene a)-related kinase 2